MGPPGGLDHRPAGRAGRADRQGEGAMQVVCLSERFDLKALFGAAFAGHAPGLELCRPEEADAAAVRHAFVYDPGPQDFARFPALELACSWGAGVDALLLHPGLPDRLAVKRMTDPEQARQMAGFAVYNVVGWSRRLWDYPARQSAARWEETPTVAPSDFPVGILGMGNMGRACAAALRGLGYPVMGWAGRARREGGIEIVSGDGGLAYVAQTSAAVICVLPLTAATRGLLNAAVFADMRSDAILIQLGRGAHLNEPDLIAALDAGRPAMAALDVFQTEPLPPDDPLWRHPRVRVTPHIASAASPENVARSIAAGIAAWERGERPEGLVDRAQGY
ncbi:glyoxylate/hydroxypyruvate reductase A [Rhodobacteraceae bacterium CCMM004]|nr:glyoxylate/hydroxypyruvate reductase A [Rhodobacteraceae bacterium CCMM004]